MGHNIATYQRTVIINPLSSRRAFYVYRLLYLPYVHLIAAMTPTRLFTCSAPMVTAVGYRDSTPLVNGETLEWLIDRSMTMPTRGLSRELNWIRHCDKSAKNFTKLASNCISSMTFRRYEAASLLNSTRFLSSMIDAIFSENRFSQ